MVMGLGAIVFAFQSASENLLVASGRTHAFLAANVIRLLSVIPATLLGYYLFGFDGFIWFNFLATLPLSIYFFYEQKRGGLLNLFDEGKLFAAAAAVFFLSLAASHLILAIIPTGWLHLGLKRH
jgi:O-antigen/teichoic acid export membrane protein